MGSNKIREQLEAVGLEPLWDSATAATFLGVPEATLNQWAYRHVGPAYLKIGRHRRYRPRVVNEWAESTRRGGDAA
ncbi:MAG: helix-turn-helix domain-containing protein [Ilumatobacteraceae bacterium]